MSFQRDNLNLNESKSSSLEKHSMFTTAILSNVSSRYMVIPTLQDISHLPQSGVTNTLALGGY